MSFLLRSATEVKTPRAITSRSIFCESQLDLVKPGRVGGGEMKMNFGVLGQEFMDSLGLVRREVIGNHVNLFALGLIGHDVCQERDELCRGVSFSRLAQHLARPGVESRVERQRAMTEVFKAVALGASRRKRQHGVLAIKRLNRRLLIHAEHRGMLWWIQIQPDYSSFRGVRKTIEGHVLFASLYTDRGSHYWLTPQAEAKWTSRSLRSSDVPLGSWASR
jgi:hypothetical protein